MPLRVAWLTYRVEYLNENHRVSPSGPPVKAALNGFDCELAADVLTAIPAEDFADVDSAHHVLKPALRGWEAHSELVDRLPFRFVPSGSQLESDDPPGSATAHAQTAFAEVATCIDRASVERDRFPAPNTAIIREGPATAQLRARWRQVLQGTEPVYSGAYWIYTKIRDVPGLNVAGTVLRKLSEVSSLSDDPASGRKVSRQGRPLSDTEDQWLRAAVGLLLRRVMEVEAGVTGLEEITMAHPSLPQL